MVSAIKYYKTHPRFSTCVLLTLVLPFVLPQSWFFSTRFLVAWDIGTGLYLTLAAIMMSQSNLEKIRLRASEQHEGRIGTLLLTTIAAIVSLVAIVEQLATAKAVGGYDTGVHVALAGVTVVFSWVFMQFMFALHYAHEYYINLGETHVKGLTFPGPEQPDYWDFVYFSFTLGATAQVSDVSVTSKTIRKFVTLHSVVAFFFNAIILALTISIGAGLFE